MVFNNIEENLAKFVSEKLNIEHSIELKNIEELMKYYQIKDKFLDIMIKNSMDDVKNYLKESFSSFEKIKLKSFNSFDYYSLTGRLIYFVKKYMLDESLAIMLVIRNDHKEKSEKLFENFLEFIYFNINEDMSFGLEDTFIEEKKFSKEELEQWKVTCSLKILAFLQIVRENDNEC